MKFSKREDVETALIVVLIFLTKPYIPLGQTLIELKAADIWRL